MKVAVISNQETQQGRSAFIVLLASLFARTQEKRATILSTGDMKSLLDMVEVQNDMSLVKSISVLNVRLKSLDITDEEIVDYALRVGEEEVYAFNFFASTMHESEIEKLLMYVVNKVDAALTIIEVVGDLEKPFNRKVLETADVVLNVYNHNPSSIKAVEDYTKNYYPIIVKRTGYICQKYDDKVLSDKRLATMINMVARNAMVVPYNPVIQKEILEGTLNKVARLISTGHEEVISMRPKLLEIMQFLYDTPKYKYIKEVSAWRK